VGNGDGTFQAPVIYGSGGYWYADFLTVGRVGQVFTKQEQKIFLAAVRERLIPNLEDTLEEWKRSNEQGDIDGMISSSKINAVRRIEEDLYA